MAIAKVQVDVDQEQIKDYINQQIQESIRPTLLLVDINRLAEITSMSPRYLEDEFLHDPRVKVHERKNKRKRWWLYEPTIKAIKNIVDEW